MMLRHRRAVVIASLMTISVGAAAGAFVAVRVTGTEPVFTAMIDAPALLLAAPGQPPPVPLPATGSFALESDADGLLASFHSGDVAPIGSVAKTMTALVVLAGHPLNAGAPGPVVTMTREDVDLYRSAVSQNGSAVAVHAGEVLTERDLLLALMLPSANNIAETLARWTSGTREAFIAQLNNTAAALGMHATHFDDPSGFSAKTVSSASDLLQLAKAATANSALADIVATPSAKLPDGTQLRNLNALLGSDDWLGIKTGWTPQAGGCLLFAERKTYVAGAAPLTVWGAVLGQPPLPAGDAAHPELGGALHAARAAGAAALQAYAVVDPVALNPALSGHIATSWGAGSGVRLDTLKSGSTMAVRLGTSLRISVKAISLSAPVRAGQKIGMVAAELNGREIASWSVVAAEAVPEPPWWWRVLHG
jgi:D-alanyl-D-alanine carboxypeptidase (penicillin-binding protein 5/6)